MDHKGFGSIDRQRDSAESGQAVAGTPLRAVLDRDTSKLARRTVHPRMSPKPKRRIRRGAMIAVRQVKKIGQVTWRFIRPPKQRRLAIVNLASAALIVVSLVIPVASVWQQGQNYDLAAAKHLLSPTPQRLQDKLRYDHAKQAWQFNENPAEQLPAPGNNSVKVGGLTYSATLPTSLRSSAGLTMTDAVNKQDITLKPQFGLGDGQQRDGHVVYPLAGSQSQLVYTFQQNGVKEDIILYEAPGDTAEYRYDLQLPAGMEARLQSDGSIGIYGGNPALFGDISYGSDKDKALVEKARTSSDKTHLYYVIPAPIVTGNGTDMVKAQFELTGSTLLVKASGLAKAHYPLSIDPSFVMDTNCSWKQGNNEGNISYDGCELSRSGLTGGTLGTWTNNTATIPVSVRDHQAVVVNGYLYVFDSGLAYYAAINDSTGEVGTLNPATTTPPSRHKFALTAVNGYIYLLGGQDGGNPTRTVYVAKPQTGGDITSWTTLPSLMNSPRSNQAVATYNNRIYVAGGCTSVDFFGACDNHVGTVEYATVQGDGSLSAWTNTTSLPTVGTFNLTSYNGYLYTAGSNDDVASNSVLYIAINSDGSLASSWAATTNLPVALVGLRPIAYKGHLYIMGGGTNLTSYVSTVYVAKIYTNGWPFQRHH